MSAYDCRRRRLFVVAFATPAFCQSRTCGPKVDVVEAARKRFESKGVRFIHVEIYEDNLPGNGVNRSAAQATPASTVSRPINVIAVARHPCCQLRTQVRRPQG